MRGNRMVLKMISNLEFFLEKANVLLEALNEYDNATDRLSGIDLRSDLPAEELGFVVDDFENIIQEREEIKERAEVGQAELIKAIEEQSEDDIKLIKCAFSGEEVGYSLTGDKRLVKDLIYRLITMQKSIVEKDNQIISKFSAVQDEIREVLKNSQSDKKKLDFLNLTATGSQDSAGFNV